VIFGLMVISFPMGAYVVFNSDIGNDINFDYPIRQFDFFLAGIDYDLPIEFELGDAFIIAWSVFLIIFSISIFGPTKNFLNVLSPIMSSGKYVIKSNYMTAMIKWFTILIVISATINFVQENLGISITPPEPSNRLIQFFEVTVAPISEEIGFRVMLIGIPLFLIYSKKSSVYFFFKSLWRPADSLRLDKSKKALTLIILVGIFFGVAHVISGEPWSFGKLTQATASGIIIGWVYFRYGLIPAILIHWATNYFIFSYIFIISEINEISIQSAFSHSLIITLETLLVTAGILSMAIMLINFLNSKKEKNLEI